MNILGISAYFHDAAAALIKDGEIVAAVQEERFTRVKNDPRLPVRAMQYCLEQGAVRPGEIDCVAFYEKPLSSFDRVVSTFLSEAPRGLRMFVEAMSLWGRHKLWVPYEIERALHGLGHRMPRDVVFTEHHESHAASAFFASPFESAAILTIDAVGEWATSTIAVGRENKIKTLKEMRFPHSVGLLYSAFTSFCGFGVNSGEYKLMGLAPFGDPVYVDQIKDELVTVFSDGSIELDLDYFGFQRSARVTSDRFDALFNGPPRMPESEITKREMDLARSVQAVTEEIVLAMAHHAHVMSGERRLCMAGGVALNCVANARILRETNFEEVWVQPAAGDAGGSLGAALAAWHVHYGKERAADGIHDRMHGSFLGPAFSDEEVSRFLEQARLPYLSLDDREERACRVAELLADGKVVGVFSGRMEFGPRALGNRSILADARSAEMQSVINRRIKHRESFRPFAPAVLEERAREFFDIDVHSPYMMFVAPVKEEHRIATLPIDGDDLGTRVGRARSTIPAVTHMDYSARLQTVVSSENPELHSIIAAFASLTGCPVVVNTSLNVRDEPIVCTPEEAVACFTDTGMDALLLERCLLLKEEPPAVQTGGDP